MRSVQESYLTRNPRSRTTSSPAADPEAIPRTGRSWMFIQLIIPCEPSEASSYSGIRLCSVMSGERPASFATELIFLPAG